MKRRIPDATVARLPQYLQALVESADRGVTTVSSEELAQAAGVNSANVRKDLSYLGSYGTRGVGYRVSELTQEIADVLGLSRRRPVVIVGIGNLGRALASYAGFRERGFVVAALLDADPGKMGLRVGELTVEPLDALPEISRERQASMAVLATPANVAQDVADDLVAAGITAILNFAPAHLQIPDGVHVRNVDLSTELQILSFYDQVHADADAAGVDDGAIVLEDEADVDSA